jgi:hypothetical protein
MGQDLDNPLPLDFEHFAAAIRKAAEVYGEKAFVVVGRGSLSASMPSAAPQLRTTGDIDLFPPSDMAKVDAWAEADLLVKQGSPFFAEHHFYIERVGEWTLLGHPASWVDRAIDIQIDDITAIVLHPLDLAYNKLEAGREKDIDFMSEGLTCGAYALAEMEAFIRDHAPDAETREMILAQLQRAQNLRQGGEEA